MNYSNTVKSNPCQARIYGLGIGGLKSDVILTYISKMIFHTGPSTFLWPVLKLLRKLTKDIFLRDETIDVPPSLRVRMLRNGGVSFFL